LTQIDRAGLARKAGHDLENGRRHLIVNRVHGASTIDGKKFRDEPLTCPSKKSIAIANFLISLII
jgi:hypothetical protein